MSCLQRAGDNAPSESGPAETAGEGGFSIGLKPELEPRQKDAIAPAARKRRWYRNGSIMNQLSDMLIKKVEQACH